MELLRTSVILAFLILNFAEFSIGQSDKGSISGGDKNPFDDCNVITKNNVVKCRNKIGQLGQASTLRPLNTTKHGGRPNGTIADIRHSKVIYPEVRHPFNCSNVNFTEGSILGNCTFENVTDVEKENATVAITSTTPLITTTTTTRPTTTVDLVALFAKLGVSTEAPEPTTTVNPLHNGTFNGTFNFTEFFNVTMEFNFTEVIIEEHPDFPTNLLKEYAEIEKASKGKPALITFDRVKLTKCKNRPHPVTKLIYFLAKSQIIVEYQNNICNCDYNDNCKTEWKDCKADGKKLCPKTCNLTDCPDTRIYGYSIQDKPKYNSNPCENKKLYKCQLLKDHGACFSGAASMVDICPDTCFYCSRDAKYLPWMPEYQKMIIWLKRFQNGKYDKYAQVFLYEENLIHQSAKSNLC